jgi:MFS family permease
MTTAQPASSPSPYAPLARPAFRWLFIAGLASNTGTWIHEVGAGWLMTELRPTPVMVALVSTATTLPMLLLSIPAGALADVLDRRRLMLAANLGMLLLAAVLALAALAGPISPWLLLAVGLGLGCGAAILNPAWQTAMTELVPREELPAASALNSVSLNLSRAIGPAAGGLLVGQLGPAAAFALNAASFAVMAGVLAAWAYRRPARAIPGERFVGALKAGFRYVRHHPPMHAVLIRTASFVLPASALWALLPLIARQHLGLGASGYGFLLGALGLGAVLATLVLPKVRARVGPNRLIVGATLLYAGAGAALALVPIPAAGLGLMALIGAAWVSMVVTLNVAAQSGTPPWVRGRALSTYLTAFFGSWALGGLAWGALAGALASEGRPGLPMALLLAAGALLLGLLTMLRWPLAVPTAQDLERAGSWEDPVLSYAIDPSDGPVVITIEYRVRPADAAGFVAAMEPVRRTRVRDGAISWILSRDTEDAERWLEVFICESWAEHLRQHDRVTVADQRVQEAAKRFHQGPGGPTVRHLIAPAPNAAGQSDHAAPLPPGHRD